MEHGTPSNMPVSQALKTAKSVAGVGSGLDDFIACAIREIFHMYLHTIFFIILV